MMEWNEWQPIYLDIVNRLGLNTEMDVKATEILTDLLRDISPDSLLEYLERSIRDKTVVICGAGPSLEHHTEVLEERPDFRDLIFVAADGATSFLLEQNYPCDIIVTDLDGNYNDIKQATDDGALTIVHGHGDNISQIREMVPALGAILGSTQVKPTNRAFLWGGFTDGDRACYVTTAYSPSEIILAGMDFGDIVGRWSKPSHKIHFPASRRKQVKLELAQELLSYLFKQRNIPYTIL